MSINSTSVEMRKAAGEYGMAKRHNHAPEVILEKEQNLVAHRIALRVEEIVETAPPLRPEQIARITALLRTAA
ncbi:hypothetical protein JOJ86_001469 [Rhodococcus percolatus]|uniref:hypothetical protein n=1 Tax=Rhodococcus opacus TaxID=37919 RepID=UPI0015FDBB93|nr:hypothetical protein [Rhodococcus opacus]MBA8958178.1 hypothetical protein [Rhodococcus opacus]MBP2203743.1 hypothetical protein [Rhodococcus opacus]